MWVATNQRQYRTRWRELTGSRAWPGFDSDRQVAAFYHVLVPSDCPELVMLSIERDDQLISRVTREFQLCDTCGRENEEVKAGL